MSCNHVLAASLLVLLASASDDSHCSRDNSRRVRTFLNKNVYPKLPFSALDLPSTCQLHPSLDAFREQELNKKEVTRGDWKCLYCTKHFRSEFYLDKHMHNRHGDKLPENGSTTACLADLCPVFGCDTAPLQLSRRGSSSTPQQPLTRAKKDFNVDKCTPRR